MSYLVHSLRRIERERKRQSEGAAMEHKTDREREVRVSW